MGQIFTRYPRQFHRLFEIIFPLLTWSLVTLPIWLSPFHPAMVAYFLLTFNVYFFYKSFTVTIYSTWSYLKLRKMAKIDWLADARKLPDFNKIYHAIIIANYKESFEKVRQTLENLQNQDFPRKRMIVVLALEKREGKDALLRAEKLIAIFKSQFGH